MNNLLIGTDIDSIKWLNSVGFNSGEDPEYELYYDFNCDIAVNVKYGYVVLYGMHRLSNLTRQDVLDLIRLINRD